MPCESCTHNPHNAFCKSFRVWAILLELQNLAAHAQPLFPKRIKRAIRSTSGRTRSIQLQVRSSLIGIDCLQKSRHSGNCVSNPIPVDRELRIECPSTRRYSRKHIDFCFDSSLLDEFGVGKCAVPLWVDTRHMIVKRRQTPMVLRVERCEEW